MQLIFTDPEAMLRANLHDVLEQVGLQPGLGLGPPRKKNIEFKSDSGDLQSTVSLVFKLVEPDEEPSSWRLSHMLIPAYTRLTFARSGWTFDYYDHDDERHDFTENLEETCEIIAGALRRSLVLKVGNNHPDHSTNEYFPRSYDGIKSAIQQEFGGVKIACEKVEGVDSYTFNDTFGRRWRIGFKQEKARIFCDEIELASVDAWSADTVGLKLSRLLSLSHESELVEDDGFKPF